MGFEIFVLYIVNELYFRRLPQDGVMDVARARLRAKIAQLKAAVVDAAGDGDSPFALFDFGLRRHYSGRWHEEVVQRFVADLPRHFRGTSNVYLAKKLGLTPIGTMAHEYLQAYRRPSASACATSRRRRSKPGSRNTAAIWAWP